MKRLLRQAKRDYEVKQESSNLFGSPVKVVIPGLNAPLKVTLPKLQQNGTSDDGGKGKEEPSKKSNGE